MTGMLDDINRRLIHIARQRGYIHGRATALVSAEGKTIGLKVPPDIRAKLELIRQEYGLSSYKAAVLVALDAGADVLARKP